MKIRSLAAAILALSFLGIGCDRLRSKSASAEEQAKEQAVAKAPQSTMPTGGRYGGDAGPSQ